MPSLSLLFVSAAWAFSFVLIKGTLAGLDFSFVSLVRMLLSLAVFLPLLKPRSIASSFAARLAGIGAVQFGLMYVAYIASFRYLPAHMVALLTSTTPLFVVLFSDLLEGRLRPAFLVAAALAVTAGAAIQYPSQPLSASLRGVILVQVSNIAFAAGQVLYKKLLDGAPPLRDREVFGLLYAGAAAVTLLASLVSTDWGSLRVTPMQAGTLAYLGLVASGLCFFLWNVSARRVNAGTLAIMNNLKIPLGIVASLILLRERTDLLRLGVSVVLMALALWLCERHSEKSHQTAL